MPYSLATKQMLCNKTNGQIDPKDYLKKHTHQSRQNVVLGIRIENHSHLNLAKLKNHPSEYNQMVNEITNIDPLSEYLFVMDNLNWLEHGVYGSISWKFVLNDESFRFVLTYLEPYK